ncbi:hypothetical protein BCR41DRAFT_355012, partial [Lobosporangium transversale]
MQSLVQYSSESESESELESRSILNTSNAAITKGLSSTSTSTTSAALTFTKDKQNNGIAATSGQNNDANISMATEDNTTAKAVSNDRSGDDDDDYVSVALKDLQSFAANIQEPTTSEDDTAVLQTQVQAQALGQGQAQPQDPLSPETIIETSSASSKSVVAGGSNPEDSEIQEDAGTAVVSALSKDQESLPSPKLTRTVVLTTEQQFIFDAFLREIDDIPLTDKDQSYPPGVTLEPLSLDSSSDPTIAADATHSSLREIELEEQWQRTQTVQSIYSRIYQLSLLSSLTIDQQSMENRLIEFAIRILDWEQGGMKPEYFVGEDRAKYMAQKTANDSKMDVDSDDDEDEDHAEGVSKGKSTEITNPPPYGGIVGEMLEYMYTIEKAAAPPKWKVVWNATENTYTYKHVATATYTKTYPSIELIHQLDSLNSPDEV